MSSRLLVTAGLFASAAIGAGAGVLVSQATAPGDGPRDVRSIVGVNSGVDGAQAKQLEKKGVGQVTAAAETRTATDSAPETGPDQNRAPGQTVGIEGVKGTDGTTAEPTNSVSTVAANDSSLQSIRGIKGIDTVMLQNLEAVLRMQAPPPPPQEGGGGGGVRAAAELLTMQNEKPPEPEEEKDDREELIEFELEGS